MKKALIICTLLSAVTVGHAQLADVSAPRALLRGVQSEMYNPVLSADGTMLMFTRDDYSDLRVYDFTDNVTTKVSATRRQAFDAHFTGDAVSLATPQVRCERSVLYITTNGVEKGYSPVECTAGYCWPSVSPDGTKVVFLAAGKGLVVCDLKGNILSRPGKYEAPVWFGNDHLVVQKATDDGHQIQSSQIILLRADGTASQALTKPESMSMSPAASIAANRVVYSTIDGRLYELTVKLR